MPLVTPGKVWVDGETVTIPKLNLTANPVVTLTQADIDVITAQSGGGVNLFSDPDLSAWTRGAGPVTCAADARTFLADHWFVRPRYNTALVGSPVSTVAASYQRESDTAHNTLLYRAKVGYESGDAGEFGDIEFGQERAARIMAACTDGFVVSIEVENQTGTAFRPKARFYSCDVLDEFGAVTEQEEVEGTASDNTVSLGNGERKLWYFRFTNPSYTAALKRGGDVVLVIPESASGAGYVRVYGLLKLETGNTPTTRVQERDQSGETSADDGTASVEPEYLTNGEFSPARFADNGGSVTCGIGETRVADGWTLVNTAGTVTSARDTGTLPNDESGASLALTGDVTATAAVQLRAKVYRADAVTALRSLAFQIYARNGTGAEVTPQLLVKTCGAPDDFNDLTTQLTQALTPVANGDWLQLSHAFDAGALTDAENGFVVEINLPANTLVSGVKTFRFAQASLKPGLSVPAWQPVPKDVGPLVFGGAVNFRLWSTGSTTFELSSNEAVLVAKDGAARKYASTFATVNIAGSGVGGLDTGAIAAATEYDVYLLASEIAFAGIIVLAGNEPTGTDAYPWRWKCSTVKTLPGSAQLPRLLQQGRSVWLQPAALTYAAAADENWHTFSIADYVPGAAIRVGGSVAGTQDCRVAIAAYAPSATAAGIGAVTLLLQDTAAVFTAPAGGSATGETGAPFDVGLAIASTLYVAMDTTGVGNLDFLISRYDLP